MVSKSPMPKAKCNQCGQNIDFDITMQGTSINCPTCNGTVDLIERQKEEEHLSTPKSLTHKAKRDKVIKTKIQGVDLKKTPVKIEKGIDSFFSKSFKVGKILTAIFLLLNVFGFCLLVGVLAINIMSPIGKAALPSFSENESDPTDTSNYARSSGYRNIDRQKLVKLANKIVNITLKNYPRDHVTYKYKLIPFLNQLSRFHDIDEIEESFDEYVSACREADIEPKECVDGFIQQIDESIQNRKDKIANNLQKRQTVLNALFYSILAFVVLLFMPLLLRIEGHLHRQSKVE